MRKTILFLIFSLFFFISCDDNKEEVTTIEPTSTPTVEITPTPTVEITPTPVVQPTYGPVGNEFTFNSHDDFIAYWKYCTEYPKSGYETLSGYYTNITDYEFNDIEYATYLIKGYCFDNEKHSNDDLCQNFDGVKAIIFYYVHDSKYFELQFQFKPSNCDISKLEIYNYEQAAYKLHIEINGYMEDIVNVKFYGYSPEERATYIEHIRTTIINSFN